MDSGSLYDPPLSKSNSSRGRSSSISATSAPRVFQANTARRQSFSGESIPTRPTIDPRSLSDDDAEYHTPPIEITPNPLRTRSASFSGPSAQDPADGSADRALWRDGRQSKQQVVEDDPKLKMTGDFEQFMAQVCIFGTLCRATELELMPPSAALRSDALDRRCRERRGPSKSLCASGFQSSVLTAIFMSTDCRITQ